MGCSLSVQYLLLIQICMFLVAHGKVRVWHAHKECGSAVGLWETVGILYMDTRELPDKLGYGECKVVLVPKPLVGSEGKEKMLMYFTWFELPGSCSDFSATLLDGTASNATQVKGAPNPLCHHNTSLTKKETPVFTTTGRDATVILRWRKSKRWTKDGFSLNFASYYDAPCSARGVVTCVNKRCASAQYYCDAVMNACGHEENTKCDERSSGFSGAVLRTVISLAVIGGVLLGCACCCKLFRN